MQAALCHCPYLFDRGFYNDTPTPCRICTDLQDDPWNSTVVKAYHEAGLHKADPKELRGRLSKEVTDPRLLEDSMRLTSPMSGKELHATVVSMFANPPPSLRL